VVIITDARQLNEVLAVQALNGITVMMERHGVTAADETEMQTLAAIYDDNRNSNKMIVIYNDKDVQHLTDQLTQLVVTQVVYRI
jgi:hypothetical protein